MVDWPGLLAWSTKYHDGTSDTSRFKVMSKEDREFLEKAMEDMFSRIEDPNKIFKDAVDQIRNDTTDEQAMTTLEVLDRCCDDPDVARNVEVHDGLTPLLNLLDSQNSTVVARTCEVLGLMIANNPPIQKAAFDKKALDKCMRITVEEDMIRQRGLIRLLSSIVRNHEEVEVEFVKLNGVAHLGKCISSGDESVATKAMSLLTYLIQIERISATTETASQVAKAITTFCEADMQCGEIMSTCAHAHAVTKSPELRDALRPRLSYIYGRENTTDWKTELEIILETVRILSN